MAAFLSYNVSGRWKELPSLVPQQEQKMAVNRSRTFHFMLPAVYGACMENVTSKAAGKLSKGDHVRQSVNCWR